MSDCLLCAGSCPECERDLNPQPAAGPWIPVAERLPDDDIDVLVHELNGDILAAFRDPNGWWVSDRGAGGHVTHWSPLYPPSEGEK